jgi:hypothetical protein
VFQDVFAKYFFFFLLPSIFVTKKIFQGPQAKLRVYAFALHAAAFYEFARPCLFGTGNSN